VHKSVTCCYCHFEILIWIIFPGLLLWARRPGDIDRPLYGRRVGSSGAAARHTAYAGSATLVVSWRTKLTANLFIWRGTGMHRTLVIVTARQWSRCCCCCCCSCCGDCMLRSKYSHKYNTVFGKRSFKFVDASSRRYRCCQLLLTSCLTSSALTSFPQTS